MTLRVFESAGMATMHGQVAVMIGVARRGRCTIACSAGCPCLSSSSRQQGTMSVQALAVRSGFFTGSKLAPQRRQQVGSGTTRAVGGAVGWAGSPSGSPAPPRLSCSRRPASCMV